MTLVGLGTRCFNPKLLMAVNRHPCTPSLTSRSALLKKCRVARSRASVSLRTMLFISLCPLSEQLGHVRVISNGGSGSSWFEVKPRDIDASSGGFGWLVFWFLSPFNDCGVSPEVGICGGEVADALMVAVVIVMIDEDTVIRRGHLAPESRYLNGLASRLVSNLRAE